MAVGDIAYGSYYTAGNLKGVTGTLEASSTATAFAILGTSSYIVSAQITNQDDTGLDTFFHCTLNSDDGTIDSDHGSLYIDTSSSDVDTFNFDIKYV